MKLPALFTVCDRQLQRLSDNSIINLAGIPCLDANHLTFNSDAFFSITIPWSLIEIEPELYNEDYLANLRDFLKQFDEKNQFVIITPKVDKPLSSAEDLESFINTFNHTARRIKDCTSMIGFEIPLQLAEKGFSPDSPAVQFIETIAVKHAQYVYFIKKNTDAANTETGNLQGIIENIPSDLPVALY